MTKKLLAVFIVLFVCACSVLQKPQEEQVIYVRSDDSLNYIKDNVVIKAKGQNFVVYRYKNVRVDEVSRLASEYCYENGLRAYLKDVVLDPANHRVATFECLSVIEKP